VQVRICLPSAEVVGSFIVNQSLNSWAQPLEVDSEESTGGT
jgi:hypothetical protein